MVCACVDIGSNTTRLLVADTADGTLEPLLTACEYTRLGAALDAAGRIGRPAIDGLAQVVADQLAAAEQAGAGRVRVVATAAVRHAANREEVEDALTAAAGGLAPDVLDGAQEARLAFAGATHGLDPAQHGPHARIAVVDVGGGSSEVAIGRLGEADALEASWSFPLGSGLLTDRHRRSDPPAADELDAMREHARGALAALDPPAPDLALAVGGSAKKLCGIVGDVLDRPALALALELLAAAPAAALAERHEIDPERVRLLPAGILILDALASALGRPLVVGAGGLREGVVLDLAPSEAPQR